MCGVLGYIGRIDKKSDSLSKLSSVSRRILKRGPDSQGSELFEFDDRLVFMQHSRLSILDLSNLGHQPMFSADNNLCISFNGEIYNYLEIAEELRGLGVQFKSKSDTEVLLAAWSQWGIEALQRFNGMFAFAIFDKSKKALWLVRDRFGVKPMLWAQTGESEIIFSSSGAAVAEFIGAEVNIDYCSRGTNYKVFETGDLASPFLGVEQVPPGGWIRFDLAGESQSRDNGNWYKLADAVANKRACLNEMSDHDMAEECKKLLNDAVNIRLRSDVPVAVSLSGGVDSTAIAAIAEQSVSDLHGFTFAIEDDDQTEGPAVARFAKNKKIHVNYVTPKWNEFNAGEALEDTFAAQEAPIVGLSVLAQHEIFRAIRKAGYKVVLGGQGGDEIFAGYRKFFIVALREAFNKGDVFTGLRLMWSLGRMLVSEAEQAKLYWQNKNRYFGNKQNPFHLLNIEVKQLNLMGASDMTLTERQIEDVLEWSLPTLLRYEDRNSMGNSVESRLPFLDYRFVEFALALPVQQKIANGYGKWILRKAIANLVPDSIRFNRVKRGFDITADLVGNGVGAIIRENIFSHRSNLQPYLLKNANLDQMLSDAALHADPNLLDEALMLAWLVRPLR